MSKNPRKAPDTRVSSKASAVPDAVPNATLDRGPGHEAILLVIAELRTELLTKAEAQSTEIRNQVDQLRAEIKLANDNANAKSEALDKRVVALESAADSHSDLLAALERDMANLQRELATQKARNEDLEARSRRNNLRITGTKERRKNGKRATDFISQCLKEMLGLDKPPLLDRAHRTLRVRPGNSDPPRGFVIRCHYYQEKEEILRKPGQMKLTMGDGDKIRIQPDYTQAVSKQRAETAPLSPGSDSPTSTSTPTPIKKGPEVIGESAEEQQHHTSCTGSGRCRHSSSSPPQDGKKVSVYPCN
ncbi:unnamed protein product [Leuciscus chuanchicus]